MEANGQPLSEQARQLSLAELLHVSSSAVTLYYELAAELTSYSQKEIQENLSLSEKKADKYLAELQSCGLVRRNPDKTYEAVAPIEAVMIALTRVRDHLRQLQKDFPNRVDSGIPKISVAVQKQVETLPYQLEKLRTNIDDQLDHTISEFRNQAQELMISSTFERFTDELQAKIIDDVDIRIMETRNQLNDFESIDAFMNVLNKLKNDVFDIVNISLSDMREQAFRLHELDDFRETLSDLWNITPSIVEGHLADFEQEMSTLE